jgi:hypothetical protein
MSVGRSLIENAIVHVDTDAPVCNDVRLSFQIVKRRRCSGLSTATLQIYLIAHPRLGRQHQVEKVSSTASTAKAAAPLSFFRTKWPDGQLTLWDGEKR